MNKIIHTILVSLAFLLLTGCENDNGRSGPLDNTVWIHTHDYYSSYFKTTTSYKYTLRFESSTYTIEYYSNHSSSPGVYSTTSGVYDISDYPNVIMVDDDGDVYVAVVDGDQLTRGSTSYYKQ